MDNMEFWGIEVKGKDATKVEVEDDHLLHLSQASLGELKKDGEPVTLYVKAGEKKLVLGVLNPKTNPQLSFDLVFEKDFEISHNWKNGSVHLLGYQSELPEEGGEFPDFSDEDEEEDLPVVSAKENGKASVKVAAPKAVTEKPNDKKSKPGPKVDSESDDEDGDDDASDEGLVDMSDDSDDDEDDDEDSSEEEEETPVKAPESGKKRKPELKTPEPKKAKLGATPQKTDGKKGAPHTATPHPAKKGGKSPPVGDKSAPKSGAQVTCGSCKKTFNSEVGLQSHTKAKHSGGK